MTNRGILKYLIDCGLIITFLLAFITGIVKFPELTPVFGNVFLLIPVSLVTKIHDYFGMVMGFLVLAHLLLNGRWIVAMTKSTFGRKKP